MNFSELHLEVRTQSLTAAAVLFSICVEFQRSTDAKILLTSYPGLPDKQLYPSVSAVYGNTEVSHSLTLEVNLM